MNERIRELAEQATTKISFRLDPTTYKHIDDPEGDFERVEFDKEKFAELIVRESITVALQELVSDEEIDKQDDIEDRCYLRGNNGGVIDSVIAIKQHFGVEE
jgi:hypothetical protein